MWGKTQPAAPKRAAGRCSVVDLLGQLSNHPPTVGHQHVDGQASPVDAVGSTPRVRGRQAPRRLTKKGVALLVKRYEDGEPIAALIIDFGITKQTLFSHLRRSGVTKRSTNLTWSDEELGEAIALYESGASLAAVADHMGVGSTTVWNRFRAAGVTLRPRRGHGKRP